MQKFSLSNYKVVILYKWVFLKNTLVVNWPWFNGVYKPDMWTSCSGLWVLIGLLSQSHLITCGGSTTSCPRLQRAVHGSAAIIDNSCFNERRWRSLPPPQLVSRYNGLRGGSIYSRIATREDLKKWIFNQFLAQCLQIIVFFLVYCCKKTMWSQKWLAVALFQWQIIQCQMKIWLLWHF